MAAEAMAAKEAESAALAATVRDLRAALAAAQVRVCI